jgi:prepilin peptidase CpaA
MQDIVLTLVLLVCVITDLKERKIYNLVLIPAFFFGLFYNLAVASWAGLGQSLLGTLAGLGILILPFLAGGIGAGDVKLLAVIGAVKGPLFALYAAVGMGLAGGIIALCLLVYKGVLFQTVWAMFMSLFSGLRYKFVNEKIMVPYGLAIAAGAWGALWWMR